jgi:hypothetical protein
MSAIDAISMIQRGVTEIMVNNLNIGTNNSSYSFPSNVGSTGQILVLNNDSLIWGSGGGGGGGISAIANSDGNLDISGSTVVTVNLNSDGIYTPELSIGNGSITNYVLPVTAGTPNQVLAMPVSGTQCVWKNDAAGTGTVTQVTGDSNFNVSNQTTTPAISLASNVGIQNLTINSAYTLPTTLGNANQVLGVPVSGTALVWKDDSAGTGTVTQVTGDSNFSVSNQTTTPAISLASNVGIQNLTINSAYTLPTTLGSANQVLGVPVSGTALVWKNDSAGTGTVTQVTGDSNFNIINTTTTPYVTLSGNVNIPNLGATLLHINDSSNNPTFNFPVLSASPNLNNIMVVGYGGGSSFTPITSLLTNTDSNVSITSTMLGTASINLNTNVNIVNLQVNSAYGFPSAIGSPNQVLSVPATGTYLEWSDNGSGSGTVTSVTSANSNISVTNTTTTPQLTLANDIEVNNLVANDGIYGQSINTSVLGLSDGNSNPLFVFPLVSANPGANNIIVSDGSGSSVFTTVNSLLDNSDGNINIVNGMTNTTSIDLASTLYLDSVTINNAYTFPSSIGSTGQVLSVPSSGSTLVWGSGSAGGDVTAVIGTSNQIAVGNSGGPIPQVGFPTAANGIQFPNNIITNVSTQGSNSGVVSIGPNSLNGITNSFTDSLLVGIGNNTFNSLTSVSGLNQCVVGNYSGTYLDTSSNYNLVYGNQSLADSTNTSSYNNIVLGHYSAQNVSSGQLNIIIGNSSLSTSGGSANNDVNENIVIGHGSLQNVVGGGAHNIILGNDVNLAIANDNGNFLVDPTHITNMTVGNIISGDATQLNIPNMKWAFNVNPTLNNQVIYSDINGNMTWSNTKLKQNISNSGSGRGSNGIPSQIPFTPNSFSFFDISTITSNLKGYTGCATDGRYLYLCPYSNTSCWTIKFDTYGSFTNSSSYQFVNLVPFGANGGFSNGQFDGRYIYFLPPTLDLGISSGQFARYDTTMSFTNSASWSFFDITTINVAYNSTNTSCFDGRYIYVTTLNIPNVCNLIRYDTTLPFTSSSSWQAIDISSATVTNGCYGLNFDGTNIYYISTTNFLFIYNINDPFVLESIGSFDLETIGITPSNLYTTIFDGNYLYIIGQSIVIKYNTNQDWAITQSYVTNIIPGSVATSGVCFDGKYLYYTPVRGLGYAQTRWNVLNEYPNDPYGYQQVDTTLLLPGLTNYSSMCTIDDYVYFIPFNYARTATLSSILARVPSYQGSVISNY